MARRVLLPGVMHEASFGMKRAWQSSVRATRYLFADVGLTAARFDMLYVLRDGKSTLQKRVRLALGVNRATVSRMLASLEQLGLVARKRTIIDRRTRLVTLTEEGARRIRLAIRRLMSSGAAQLAFDTALAADGWHDDNECFLAMDGFERFLRRVRRTFGDFATLYYPWGHPDD